MNVAAEDTRRYETHAEWCVYLAQRGQLAPLHRPCKTSYYCKAYDAHVIR